MGVRWPWITEAKRPTISVCNIIINDPGSRRVRENVEDDAAGLVYS